MVKIRHNHIHVFFFFFSQTGLLVNCNLKKASHKAGVFVDVLYNSAQTALNLLTFIEKLEDFDNNSLYEISCSLRKDLSNLHCKL